MVHKGENKYIVILKPLSSLPSSQPALAGVGSSLFLYVLFKAFLVFNTLDPTPLAGAGMTEV